MGVTHPRLTVGRNDSPCSQPGVRIGCLLGVGELEGALLATDVRSLEVEPLHVVLLVCARGEWLGFDLELRNYTAICGLDVDELGVAVL